MFRDECEIEVIAGRGGDGLVAFRREKFVPRGGPWGGDGGDGGDVVLVSDSSLNSLLFVGRRPRHEAGAGMPGGPANCSGRRGSDLVVAVPVGTQVRDAERGHLLKDLSDAGDSVIIAKGGTGGRGNARFANSVRQAPRHAEPGRAGERRSLRLELKLVAEVGIVGLPNAGKSTLLSLVSAATPKVADYPFTTLEPRVGIAHVGDYDTLCIADLPGLIEGASRGVGLGHQFLKHVERCSVLVHLVDVSASAQETPFDAWRTVRHEIELYSAELAKRPYLLAASKVEDEESVRKAFELERTAGERVFPISAHTGRGVPELLVEAQRLARGLALR